MAKHTTSEHSFAVDGCLIHHLMRLHLKSENILPAHDSEALQALIENMSYALQLTADWVSWKGGCLVQQPLMLYDVSATLH